MAGRFILNIFKLNKRKWLQIYRFSSASTANITPQSPSNIHARNVMKERGNYMLWPECLLKFTTENAEAANNKKNLDQLATLKNMIEKAKSDNLDLLAEENVKIIREVQAEMHNFSDEQLLQILTHLLNIKPVRFKRGPIADFRNVLSVTIESRCRKWNVNQLLLIADIWFSLPHKGNSNLIGTVCDVLTENISTMTPPQLVQTLFYINTRKSKTKNRSTVEAHLAATIHQLSLEELSIVLLGFVMADWDIYNPILVSDIFWKLLDRDLTDVSSLTLGPYLKILRRTRIPIHETYLDELMQKLYRTQHNWSRFTITHISRFASSLRSCNQDLLEAIAVHALDHLGNFRTKDIGVISHALMLFNFRSQSGVDQKLFKAFLDILPNHGQEFDKHPGSVASCLYNLAIRGFHSPELIAHALRSIKCTKGITLHTCKQLLFLDSYTRINLNGNGWQLDENFKKALVKIYCTQMPNSGGEKELSDAHKILLGALASVQSLKLDYKLIHAMPYFRTPNIFIVMHSINKCSIDRSEKFPTELSGQIINSEMITAAHSNQVPIAILIAGPRHYVFKDNVLEYDGEFRIGLNQLELLGINPLIIPFFEWKTMIPVKRDNYITEKIMSILNK